MRVLILGGGKVGQTIAEILGTHHHDVTVIESDENRAKQLDDLLDSGAVITGSAAHADALFQADVASAEVCLAVTGCDEVNLVGASIAKTMGARRVAARIFSSSIQDTSTVDYQKHFGVDRLMSIEHLTAAEFAREIRVTGELTIDHFAGGEIEIQEILIFDEPPSAMRKPLAELKFPPDVRVGVIRREGEIKIAMASDMIQQGDRISLIGTRETIEKTKKKFQGQSPKAKRILIGGGGEIGYQLALILHERRHLVTIMEAKRERCDYLSVRLPGCTVIQGDVTNRTLLQNEHIHNFDGFVACTGEDEKNIIAALEVKSYSEEIRTMVLVDRPDYRMLTEKLKIDQAIVPASVIAKQVLGFLNHGPILFRNMELFGQAIDVVELEVTAGAKITEDTLRNVPLPRQCLLAAVMRTRFVQVPNADFRFLPGDTVVALVQPEMLAELVQFF